jgi:hypothetical protein
MDLSPSLETTNCAATQELHICYLAMGLQVTVLLLFLLITPYYTKRVQEGSLHNRMLTFSSTAPAYSPGILDPNFRRSTLMVLLCHTAMNFVFSNVEMILRVQFVSLCRSQPSATFMRAFQRRESNP